MYTQNDKGTKLIRDNFVFNGFRNGIDGYTTRGPLRGFEVVGNTCFGSAASANEGGHKMDILFGGLGRDWFLANVADEDEDGPLDRVADLTAADWADDLRVQVDEDER